MKISQVALQLYTLRSVMDGEEAILRTLDQVRAIGYEAVEPAGFGPFSPAEFKQRCTDAGLRVVSCHHNPAETIAAPEKAADVADALGVDIVGFPAPSGFDLTTREGVDKLIEGLAKSGDVLAGRGKKLVYHNHHFEFFRLDGEPVLRQIFARTGPQQLQAELDVHWVQRGGGDPAQWCSEVQGRLPIIHLKDYAINADREIVFAEIGQGNLDFAEIIQAAEEAGCGLFVVENDAPGDDPLGAVKISWDYIKANLAQG